MPHDAQDEVTRMGHHALQLGDAILTVERRLSRLLHQPDASESKQRELFALLQILREVRAYLSAGMQSAAEGLQALYCGEGSDNSPS